MDEIERFVKDKELEVNLLSKKIHHRNKFIFRSVFLVLDLISNREG
jgi:hypothetical protein